MDYWIDLLGERRYRGLERMYQDGLSQEIPLSTFEERFRMFMEGAVDEPLPPEAIEQLQVIYRCVRKKYADTDRQD